MDSLYVSRVDVGDAAPRVVVSGVAGLVSAAELDGRLAVFVCNLNPAVIKGVESHAMMLCANRSVCCTTLTGAIEDKIELQCCVSRV